MSLDNGYGDACVIHENNKAYCWNTSGSAVLNLPGGTYEAAELSLGKADPAFISMSEYRACVAYHSGGASCKSDKHPGGTFSPADFTSDTNGAGIPTLVNNSAMPKFTEIEGGWNDWVCGVDNSDTVTCFQVTQGGTISNITEMSMEGMPQAASCQP